MQAPCGKISRLDKKRAANKKTLNLRTDNIYDIVRFLYFRYFTYCGNKVIRLQKGVCILFSIINSLDTPSYISLILLIIATLTFYLIKYKKYKINKPGRIVFGCEIIPMIMLIVTRLLEEYRPYDILLCKISRIATYVSGGVFFIVLIVMAYIAKKKR